MNSVKLGWARVLGLVALVAAAMAPAAQAVAPAYATDITGGIADGGLGATSIITALVAVLVIGVVWKIVKRFARA